MDVLRQVKHLFALDAAGAGLAVLAVLAVFEVAEPGSVSAFFNLNWLVLWIVAASLMAFSTHSPSRKAADVTFPALGLLIVAVIAAGYVWRTFEWRLSPMATIVAVCLTSLTILMAAPLLTNDTTEK
jgi:hypothetical protein